jgi:hypothetical protein
LKSVILGYYNSSKVFGLSGNRSCDTVFFHVFIFGSERGRAFRSAEAGKGSGYEYVKYNGKHTEQHPDYRIPESLF